MTILFILAILWLLTGAVSLLVAMLQEPMPEEVTVFDIFFFIVWIYLGPIAVMINYSSQIASFLRSINAKVFKNHVLWKRKD